MEELQQWGAAEVGKLYNVSVCRRIAPKLCVAIGPPITVEWGSVATATFLWYNRLVEEVVPEKWSRNCIYDKLVETQDRPGACDCRRCKPGPTYTDGDTAESLAADDDNYYRMIEAEAGHTPPQDALACNSRATVV